MLMHGAEVEIHVGRSTLIEISSEQAKCHETSLE
jgi:hypothetical protein